MNREIEDNNYDALIFTIAKNMGRSTEKITEHSLGNLPGRFRVHLYTQ